MENQQQRENEVSFCLHGKHLLQFKKKKIIVCLRVSMHRNLL